jgi:hypothetical protein
MRTTNKIISIIAVILFVGAGLAWQRSQHIIHQYRWIVLEKPIRLEDGFSTWRPFTVDVAAKYWVEIECRKRVSIDTIDQILSKKLAAEYAVTSGKDRITSGDTSKELSMGYTDDYISRCIATFDATPGIPYNLALRIMAGVPELASTRPTVKVSVEPIVFKNAFVSASLSTYLALGLVLLGLLCIVFGFSFSTRK